MLKLRKLIEDLQKLEAQYGDIPVMLDIKKFANYSEIHNLGIAKNPDYGTPFAVLSDNPLRQRSTGIITIPTLVQ